MGETPLNHLMGMTDGYRQASILAAACELDLFTAIIRQDKPVSVEMLAQEQRLNVRALAVLLDALTVSGLLRKTGQEYAVAEEYREYLDSRHEKTMVPMIRHSIFCQRQWGQLAWTVKSGVPAPRHTSLLGALADNQSFILGMNSIASRIAGPLADEMDKAGLLTFRHMLDLGGASGTYAKVFLDRIPNARATVFDLPIAIHEAEKMLKGSPYESRIQLCEGDFYRDEFPTGFDFIWISAIIHQQDDDATRTMFEKSFRALVSGGKIAIRDVYINQERTGPPAAVFFAVNMLCNTEQGKVYTQGEVFRLLEEAGFKNPALVVPADDMRAVIVAQKP